MEQLQLLIVIVLLVILAEATYLVAKLPRQTMLKKQTRPILIDTSVLIDGRIIPVAKSGFISDTLVIPRSVIGELQFLADNADHEKRARARHGLDVVTELQAMPQVKVEILPDGSKADEGVDERLLTLAKKHGAAICTIDYNLNKVAVVEGTAVLNINELSQSLRMAYLPGEKMLLELVQKGQDAHQAVGYLPDGTMVVVEHAYKQIGQSVEVEFIRSLQTAAGKMMFARMNDRKQQQPEQQKVNKKPIGKKPIAPVVTTTPKPAVVVAAPAPQQHTTRPQQEAQTVFHSDPRDSKTATRRREKTPQNNSARSHQNQRNASAPKQQNKRPNDRESVLLDLVDKQ